MSKMRTVQSSAEQRAMLAMIQYHPLAAALLLQPTRFERMAQELAYAISHTNSADMAKLAGFLATDAGSAFVRRVTGLVSLAEKVGSGTAYELASMYRAYSADRLTEHLGGRVGTASGVTSRGISNGAKSLSTLASELIANPAEAAPKLLVLVLSSVAASGGIDGNGGAPDLDIPLMGIGAHRSPLTHSILVGSLLETAVLLLTRIVLCTHKNLPPEHDPLWGKIAGQSVEILSAAGKGASAGIAYHLMVDAVLQPGAYHGVPFDMPIEVHQAIFAANAAAEGEAASTYPDESTLTTTPDILAAHKRYRAIKMSIPTVLSEFLNADEIVILTKYGSWLQALVKRAIPPTTIAQVQLLKVADGHATPKTPHELAWMALNEAKVLAGRKAPK